MADLILILIIQAFKIIFIIYSLFGENIFDFGSVSIDEYGRKYEAKIQELTGILEANQENMYSAW